MLFNLPPFGRDISSVPINHTEVSLLSDYRLNHANIQLLLLISIQIDTHGGLLVPKIRYTRTCSFIGLSYRMFPRSL